MACTGVWLKYSLCYFIEKKKLIFPSLSICQLQITSWLEVGHWDYFFLSVLRFLSKLNLHKSSAWCHSLCAFICGSALLCLEKAASSGMPRAETLSMSSLQRALSLEFNKDIIFNIKYSTVSHSLHIMQVWVTVLITIYCKKELLWWEVSNVLIYGYNNTLFGHVLFAILT